MKNVNEEKIFAPQKKAKIIAIVGPTASGKSSLGINLAKRFNGEIVSADSRQIYRGLNLTSGKVSQEEQLEAKHHLIDIKNVNENYSVTDFQKDAYAAIDEILSRGKNVFLVGGTGLYARAIIEGFGLSEISPSTSLREKLENESIENLQKMLADIDGNIIETDKKNKRRLIRAIELAKNKKESVKNSAKYNTLVLGLTFEKEELNKRILQRIYDRLSDGMLEEVVKLKENGATNEFLNSLGLDAKYVNMLANKEFKTKEEFAEALYIKTRQFAKRQMTWFRKEKNIIWLNTNENYEKEAEKLVNEFLKEQ